VKVRDTVRAHIEREMAKPVNTIEFVDDDFMSNQQIAKKFAISENTVLRAQNDGQLAYCTFGERKSSRPTRRSPKRAGLAWAAARLVRA